MASPDFGRLVNPILTGEEGVQIISETLLLAQSHDKEVPRWEVFMEQELRLGLDYGRLAVLKKRPGLIMNNFGGWFFHVFRGKKIA